MKTNETITETANRGRKTLESCGHKCNTRFSIVAEHAIRRAVEASKALATPVDWAALVFIGNAAAWNAGLVK